MDHRGGSIVWRAAAFGIALGVHGACIALALAYAFSTQASVQARVVVLLLIGVVITPMANILLAMNLPREMLWRAAVANIPLFDAAAAGAFEPSTQTTAPSVRYAEEALAGAMHMLTTASAAGSLCIAGLLVYTVLVHERIGTRYVESALGAYACHLAAACGGAAYTAVRPQLTKQGALIVASGGGGGGGGGGGVKTQ